MPISQLTRNISGLPTKSLKEGAPLLRECGVAEMNLSIGEPTNEAPISTFSKTADYHDIGQVINGDAENGQIINRGIQSLGYAKLEHTNIKEGLLQPSSLPEYLIPISIDLLTGESVLPKSGISVRLFGRRAL